MSAAPNGKHPKGANIRFKPALQVTITAFGGSVTSGMYYTAPNGSWVDEVQAWLRAAFPAVKFTVQNFARPASDVTAASSCWYQYMSPKSDLVMIEYSANGCTALQCLSIISQRVSVSWQHGSTEQ